MANMVYSLGMPVIFLFECLTNSFVQFAAVYCNECFNAWVASLSPADLPLTCAECRRLNPNVPAKQAVAFGDADIMMGLNDVTRVRYVQFVKTRQPPGTVRVHCGAAG